MAAIGIGLIGNFDDAKVLLTKKHLGYLNFGPSYCWFVIIGRVEQPMLFPYVMFILGYLMIRFDCEARCLDGQLSNKERKLTLWIFTTKLEYPVCLFRRKRIEPCIVLIKPSQTLTRAHLNKVTINSFTFFAGNVQ